ncbi:MAG: class I SAM-dependent methyltransferase [Gemmatimonadaceae bacterium]
MDRREHWENIHATKGPNDVSWFEPRASRSLALIERMTPDRATAIIDVGAGASTLVDSLLDSGYRNIKVLDISAAALDRARQRLGERAASVEWIEADILSTDLPAATVDVWHDRAVFHFLTSETDRARYVEQLRSALRPGGYAIIATFAEDGPTRCSGLDIVRYSGTALHDTLGHDFLPVSDTHELHHTPWGAEQAFTYCCFRYEPAQRPNGA